MLLSSSFFVLSLGSCVRAEISTTLGKIVLTVDVDLGLAAARVVIGDDLSAALLDVRTGLGRRDSGKYMVTLLGAAHPWQGQSLTTDVRGLLVVARRVVKVTEEGISVLTLLRTTDKFVLLRRFVSVVSIGETFGLPN